MINRIVHYSIQNKFITTLFLISVVILGIYEFKKLPIDAVPDITNNQVQVITVSPSYSALDIERLVTFPIEQACSNINGLVELRSFSRFGLSLVTLVFDDDVDIYWARQQIAERLQTIQNEIPPEIGKPEIGPITTGLGEIYQYVVRPEPGYENKYSLTDLRMIQDWIVRRQLIGIKGVAEVSSFGGQLKQIEIAVNLDKLNAYHLNILDIAKSIELNNENAGSAYVEKNEIAYFIRTEGLVKNISDIENIVVGKTSDTHLPILLKDVAEIRIGSARRYGALLYQDKYEVAGGVVMMLKGENSNIVIERVKDRIAEIQKSLPEGIVIEPFLDRTKMVNNTLRTVWTNLIEGALIVIVVLILFIGNIPFGLLVASVIPLSMIIAVIFMNMFKVSGNLMSLGALDFGLIVDGAVIIVEAIIHQLMLQKNSLSIRQSDDIVYNVSSKMMNTAIFGQLIILVVYIPILSFSGIEGKMFKPMAQTVIFALIGAFILSITYIPMMSSWLLKLNASNHVFQLSDMLMSKLEQQYFKWYKRFFRRSSLWITITLFLLGTSIVMLTQMGGEFIPSLEEGDFAVETRVLTGSGLSTTIEYCKKVSRIISENFPDEVEKTVAKIGSGEIPTDPMPIEAADIMIILKDKKHWKKAKTFEELADKMQDKLKEITGLHTSFQYPVQMRFNELMTGAKQDVVCKIYGESIDSLLKYANITAQHIADIDGITDLFVEPIHGQPQILITYNREKLAAFNVSISDVNKVIQSAYAGYKVGTIYENERRFDIVIRLDNPNDTINIEDIKNLLVPTNDHQQIPLYQIADVSLKTDINQIQRDMAKRRIVVAFNVRGRDIESVVQEIKNKMKAIKLPAGYYVSYGGNFENLESARKRLLITVPTAFSLIFIFLFFATRSVRLGILIYSAIPMASIGGIIFLYARNIPFSISAGVGFIALFGISVLNGIILINEFHQLKQSISHPIKLIFTGIKKRLRPVVMTTSVASLGFLPMFISTDVGANVQKPLATVVIGGLISSTLLTLFILPVLYYHFELKKQSPIKMNFSKTYLIVVLLLILPHFNNAQTLLTYQQIIDSVMIKNLEINNIKNLDEYYKNISKTGWDLPKTAFALNYGQYNSAYIDQQFSISQNIALPVFYGYQSKVLKQEWKINRLTNEWTKKEIKNNVSNLFYDIVYLKEKKKVLHYVDSLYKKAIELIELQYQKGSISELEKNTAILNMNNIAIQYRMIDKDLNSLLITLKMFLNIPYDSDIDVLYDKLLFSDTSFNLSISENTLPVQISAENIILQKYKVNLEKSKLLPEVFMGYYNQSLTGWGGDNVYYPSSKRFQFIQIGASVPLFFTTGLKKINGEKSMLKWIEMHHTITQKKYEQEIRKLMNEYLHNKELISLYENQNIPLAENIVNVSYQMFEKGSISFLEWIQSIHHWINTKNQYLDLIKSQNDILHRIAMFK